METIVIVGGGITGLCTAYYLNKQLEQHNKQANIYVLEANDYVGGKIHSEHAQGFIMETGADSIVARHPGVLELVRDIDFEQEIVYNETGISYIHTNNELHAIPAGSTFGIPMSVEALMSSTLLSDEAKQRVLQDEQIPNDKFTKNDSIGAFLTYFLGEDIVKKQIAPVLAGVYSGDLYQLSLASTLPYLVDYKNEYGSIMKGFEANREKFEKAADKKFISFQHGLSSLLERIAEKLPNVHFKLATKLEKLTKANGQYELQLSSGNKLIADKVVLALPNDVVKHVLPDPALQQHLTKFTSASALTVYLGYNVPDSVLPADGTGFIVSHNSDLVCNASTWTSRKWKHTSADSNLLVRLFYKNVNPRYEELAAMSDEELTAVAREDIRRSLKIEEAPQIVNITKWIGKMPRYDLAHKQALADVTMELEQHYPNVYLAGCAYYGVGIGACIKNGKQIGEKLAASVK